MIRTSLVFVACSSALAYILASGMALAQTQCTTQTLQQGGSPSAPTVKVCVSK